jgi:hypothetical protein
LTTTFDLLAVVVGDVDIGDIELRRDPTAVIAVVETALTCCGLVGLFMMLECG